MDDDAPRSCTLPHTALRRHYTPDATARYPERRYPAIRVRKTPDGWGVFRVTLDGAEQVEECLGVEGTEQGAEVKAGSVFLLPDQ